MSIVAKRDVQEQIVLESGRVRQRYGRQERARDRRDPAGGNDVVREWYAIGGRARGRIVQSQPRNGAEVARSKIGDRHSRDSGDLPAIEIAFVVDEEERRIAANRTT